MIKQSLLSMTILSLNLLACEGSKFAEAEGTALSYRVNVVGESPSSEDMVEDEGSNVTSNSEPEGSNIDDQEKLSCSKIAGVKAGQVKISGSEQDIVIAKDNALAFRVTGNKNTVKVDLTARSEGTIKAICLFIAGNQNKIEIDNANHLAAVYIIARGNKAKVEILNRKGSAIDRIDLDAKGNSASLELTGEGNYPCDKSNENIVCQ
jgi:hypothetical protein